MSEMVERVARAIAKDRGEDWNKIRGGLRAGYMSNACAVIEAMREPTEEDQFAELRIRCIAVERRLESVQHTLREAKRKLSGYISLHGSEPVSGMEYDALMGMIDEALK